MFMGKKLTQEEIIIRFDKLHNSKYTYDNVVYVTTKLPVIITCKVHGNFTQVVSDHLSGCGCPNCDPTLKLSTEEFIYRSNILHNNLYSYEFTKYGLNNYDKVIITCRKHGNFEQTPFAHLKKQGCPKCFGTIKKTNAVFIEDAIRVHGTKFDYSKVEYISNKKKVDIICNIHGIFSQRASVHLDGFGCKQCKSSSRGEKMISDYLIKNNIKYVSEKRFDDCRNTIPLPFDFWLPDHNICIEYDGIQHFQAVDWFGGEERYQYTKQNDSIKTQYCLDNNIKLIRVTKDDNVKKLIDIKKTSLSKEDIIDICKNKSTIPLDKLQFDNSKNRTVIKNTNHAIYLEASDLSTIRYKRFKAEFAEFISQYNIEIINDFSIGQSTCDIYLPTLKLGFKLLGLFEHGEINVNKNNQLQTYNDFSNNEMKIIQIFEDSWFAKDIIIKSRITNLLGRSESLYARKCDIRFVDTKEAGAFINQTHIQGTVGAAVKIGLYYNNELVSIMTFGSLRKNLGQKSTQGDYELLRFCNKLNTNVVGAASKLFSYFNKTYNPRSIISYADKCWSNSANNIYKSLNLKYVHESEPSYYYIIGNKRKGRFAYRKDQLLLCGYDGTQWTEHTICLANNIYRIFDVGTCKYEWKA